MAERDERERIAKKHIGLMKNVYGAEIAACVKSARIFEDGDGRELDVGEARFEGTETCVTGDFAAKVVYRNSGKCVVVDAGSFTRPGGTYETGGGGPESMLCADSALYPVLAALKETYYDKNRGWESGQLMSDRALYLTDVPFSRGGERRDTDVVVIAAPNRTRALENGRSPELCDQYLGFRIEAMLRVAAQGGADVLVCPAFGCGRDGNDTAVVIEHIKSWLEAHPGVFEKVVFSVPRSSEAAFVEAFGREVRETRPVAVVATSDDDDEEDDEDWRDIELPEGITLG